MSVTFLTMNLFCYKPNHEICVINLTMNYVLYKPYHEPRVIDLTMNYVLETLAMNKPN